MERKRAVYWIWTILVLFLFSVLVGCAVQRRPASPEQGPGIPPGARQVLPNDPREASRLAERMAGVAERERGVKSATVVLAGSTAYVGVNLDDNVEREQTGQVKRNVATKVKDTDARVARVLVSTDPDIVTRLERIAGEVEQGRPITAFTDEIEELNKRMTPTSR